MSPVIIVYLALFLLALSGWVSHIIYCFTHSEWVLLLVGAIAAPIGTLHGIYTWFI